MPISDLKRRAVDVLAKYYHFGAKDQIRAGLIRSLSRTIGFGILFVAFLALSQTTTGSLANWTSKLSFPMLVATVLSSAVTAVLFAYHYQRRRARQRLQQL
jgi:heme/copper-type cytochrome/quinol oxidase subunit 3